MSKYPDITAMLGTPPFVNIYDIQRLSACGSGESDLYISTVAQEARRAFRDMTASDWFAPAKISTNDMKASIPDVMPVEIGNHQSQPSHWITLRALEVLV